MKHSKMYEFKGNQKKKIRVRFHIFYNSPKICVKYDHVYDIVKSDEVGLNNQLFDQPNVFC